MTFFDTLDELKDKIKELRLDIPISNRMNILHQSAKVGRFMSPNALVVQPMEGCDATFEGAPTELTFRRYRRFAAGGAGLIWFEATAVAPEGRANPRQLWLHERNINDFKKLVKNTRNVAKKSMGKKHEPIFILQLTHSGRYSKPNGKPVPVIVHRSRILDPLQKLGKDYPVITDSELDRLQNNFIKTAKLARQAGFHGVDIKSCHGYLISELLASFTRSDSRYGGSFENRARFLLETVQKIKDRVPDLEVTCRLNIFDGIPYPYGFGVDKNDYRKEDLREPLKLLDKLKKNGISVINIAIGNPYFNPHLERPVAESHINQEHPLKSIARMLRLTSQIKDTYKEMTIISSGYSWLRHYSPYVASGVLEKGWTSMVGLGRGALAYPDFANDIFEKGKMEKKKVCLTCSACSKLLQKCEKVGCVVRDSEVYGNGKT